LTPPPWRPDAASSRSREANRAPAARSIVEADPSNADRRREFAKAGENLRKPGKIISLPQSQRYQLVAAERKRESGIWGARPGRADRSGRRAHGGVLAAATTPLDSSIARIVFFRKNNNGNSSPRCSACAAANPRERGARPEAPVTGLVDDSNVLAVAPRFADPPAPSTDAQATDATGAHPESETR